ncbi:MPPN (rrmlike) domain containing protein [Acanthamoeba castellanii str. Neff]|uniref:MPPN (Rrmlike) domain containing protein n=1 Tax=Acanthamoeba castellanii (strain ATCC 30010 / Neff) TaxID=1257118 RepID=L8GLP4_ACACF|nr:MPPN (rrmlike) domain containing protein [Acanthamoeba castellanii str. Neff]ELR14000.1 MPPN (rrmlike) domain containing protein [Acanthamoeba castellanii str. Neff]
MWSAGDYGDQTPMQRRPSMGADYGGDSTAPRTAQRTTMPSYLFPSTPYHPAARGLAGQDRTRSRDAGLDEVYTPIATPARGGGRYGDMAGSTPGFGQTPTAAGYTPFRRPQMAEERSMPGIATSSAEGVPGEEQPPTRSLYDELEEEESVPSRTMEPMYMGYAFAIAFVNHGSRLTRISSASRSPGEELDIESGTWVTVFGFPPSQASHVLKLFQEIGEVTRTQARQALSRNGKTFGGNLMVGVTECTDAAAQATGSSLAEFPRPLNAPVQPKPGSHQIDLYGPKVPKRSDSTWSKIMEYVIGA